jgi:hypothetical protein
MAHEPHPHEHERRSFYRRVAGKWGWLGTVGVLLVLAVLFWGAFVTEGVIATRDESVRATRDGGTPVTTVAPTETTGAAPAQHAPARGNGAQPPPKPGR